MFKRDTYRDWRSGMKTFRIYTAGKMYGLSFDEQMNWRKQIENKIRVLSDVSLQFIHPPLFYKYDEKNHQTEREVKEWELNQIRNSDIVIVSLDGVNDSIGTHFELSTADAVNSFGNKFIYIIGIGKSKEPLHPWIEASLFRKEENYADAAEYITNYLLI